MQVEIYLNVVKWSPLDPFVGGTEETVIQTAETLVKLGYKVIVYYDQSTLELNGVTYKNRKEYPCNYPEVLIAFKAIPKVLAKRNIYITNDINDRAEHLPYFDWIVGISEWHLDYLLGRTPKTVVIPPACWVNRFETTAPKVPLSCLYSSSPDRGLEFLLSIWENVHKRTGAKLYVTYGAKVAPIPGVTFLGKLSEPEMEKLYKISKYWLHPCQGVELFCISGYKAMCAKCIPIYIPNMALSETIKYGFKCTPENFEETVINVIKNDLKPEIPKDLHFKDWMDVTKELVILIMKKYS